MDWYRKWKAAKARGLSRKQWLCELARHQVNTNATRSEALMVLIRASTQGFEDEPTHEECVAFLDTYKP